MRDQTGDCRRGGAQCIGALLLNVNGDRMPFEKDGKCADVVGMFVRDEDGADLLGLTLTRLDRRTEPLAAFARVDQDRTLCGADEKRIAGRSGLEGIHTDLTHENTASK